MTRDANGSQKDSLLQRMWNRSSLLHNVERAFQTGPCPSSFVSVRHRSHVGADGCLSSGRIAGLPVGQVVPLHDDCERGCHFGVGCHRGLWPGPGESCPRLDLKEQTGETLASLQRVPWSLPFVYLRGRSGVASSSVLEGKSALFGHPPEPPACHVGHQANPPVWILSVHRDAP